MILIVHSGSTKTDWTGIDNTGKVIFESQTLGLNPQVLNSNIIIIIPRNFHPMTNTS